MIGVKFSQTFDAKRMRINRLPKLLEGYADTRSKKDAINLIEQFQRNIANDNLGLERLKPETVKGKRRKGYRRAARPLLGLASIDSNNNRVYKNLLMIRKLKNGYRVTPSNRKHHSGKIKLKELFNIHENGATIRARGKSGKSIIIPPRPAFKLTVKRYLRSKRRIEEASDMKKAMTSFIKTGSQAQSRKLLRKPKNWKKYDV